MIIVIFTKICYEHLVIILTQNNDGSFATSNNDLLFYEGYSRRIDRS